MVAWQLLTAISLGRRTTLIDEPGRSMVWFPLVGLVIGAMLAGLDLLLGKLWPPLPASALLLAVWVGLTGALHLDGWVDCCDGLLSTKTAEQRLEVMNDSRVGAFGVVGAICLMLVKFSALSALPTGDRLNWLLLVPVLSRWLMVWAAWRYPTARPDGFAVWFRRGLKRPQVSVAGATALLVAFAVMGARGLVTFAALWLLAWLFIMWVQRRIPGLTGDVYGALNELSEVAGLLVAVALAGIAL